MVIKWKKIKEDVYVKVTPKGVKSVRYDYSPRGIASTPHIISTTNPGKAQKSKYFKTKTEAKRFMRSVKKY